MNAHDANIGKLLPLRQLRIDLRLVNAELGSGTAVGAIAEVRVDAQADVRGYSQLRSRLLDSSHLACAVGDHRCNGKCSLDVRQRFSGCRIQNLIRLQTGPLPHYTFRRTGRVNAEALRQHTLQHLGIGIAFRRVEKRYTGEIRLQTIDIPQNHRFFIEVKAIVRLCEL